MNEIAGINTKVAMSRTDTRLENDWINLLSCLPFIFVHVGCVLVYWVGWSWFSVIIALLSYAIRMFGITAGFHRYFSHRSFKTTRAFQFVLACLGTAAAQMGPLWWASYHRHHHRYSDTEKDVHSPSLKGFWWSHLLWFQTRKNSETDLTMIRDFAKYKELRFLNRYHILVPIGYATLLFCLGGVLQWHFPVLETSPLQVLTWGFFISTIFLYHFTFSINTFCHLVGRRRFETSDHSRNSFLFAIVTMGEGWHNNHHYYPASERQGFYWWEIDITHYILSVLSFLGIVWALRKPPEKVYLKN